MQALELKVPPPLVALCCAILMWLVSKLTGTLTLVQFSSLFNMFAVLLVLTGLGIGLTAVLEFRKAQTTINPVNPESSSTLVDTGIFSKTRNPMYLGVLLILSGWAVFLANPLTMAGLLVFVLYITRFQIMPEERALTGIFASEFEDYCNRVGRWI